VSAVETAAREFLRGIDERDIAAVTAVIAPDFRFLRPVRQGDREVDRQYIAGRDSFLDFLGRRFTVRPSDHQVEVWAETGLRGLAEGRIVYPDEGVVVGFLFSARVNADGELDYVNTTLYPLVPADAPSTAVDT